MYNYCIFSYKEDYASLDECIKSIQALDSFGNIFIFDDGKNPLLEHHIPKAYNIYYKKTFFNRNNNLNGLESIRGQLQCYYDIVQQFDCPIIKIDCDTILNSLKMFNEDFEAGYHFTGCNCLIPYCVSGCCYGFTPQFVYDAIEHVLHWEHCPQSTECKYEEDCTFSRIASYLYGKQGFKLHEFNDGEYMIGIRDCAIEALEFYRKVVSDKKNLSFIHCGQMNYYKPLMNQYNVTIREAVAIIMQVLKYGKDHHIVLNRDCDKNNSENDDNESTNFGK